MELEPHCKHRALPSVILADMRHKTDELQAIVNHMQEYRTASILAFKEKWLNKNISDDTLCIDSFGTP